MSEVNDTTPEGLPKSNDPSLGELAGGAPVGPGDMPPPPGYDPNSGLPPAPPSDETRMTLGDVPHPELHPPMPGPGPEPPPARPERKLSTDIFEIEPGTLPPHRYAALFPLMTPHEHAELRHAIELCGQQVLAVRFQGQLLDGRNRDIACTELGIRLRIVDYLGTEEEAFDYVMNANRFQRDLSASQRAAIGVELMAYISPDLEKRRLEKLKATWARKREGDSMTPPAIGMQAADEKVPRAREIAADIMGVNPTYVGQAARVKRENPELFEKIWLGQITVTAAIRELDGVTETPIAYQISTLRRRLNAAFRKPDLDSGSLARIEQVLDELGL